MKLIFTIITICGVLAGFVYGESTDSTASLLASSMYQMLNYDTTGIDLLPRAAGLEYARMGFAKAGDDLGKPAMKLVEKSSGALSVLVDTATIQIKAVGYDTAGYVRRFLVQVPLDTIRVIQGNKEVSDEKRATHFAQFGDSLILVPVTTATDTFQVIYWKRCKHLSDSTTATDLPEEYREAALIYGCYLASMAVQNGRAGDFFTAYKELRNDILTRRVQ